ncbi:hypothetical protein WJ0W_004726 [Paenibacillus melissococcoides]|uniref:Uncharacterized protein n=2 Tax=Paenibacillus TaxID=44249 RepID=A0ABN8U8N1_9BACL|nr:hypothetical protein [Paenibacillus melissococcoides]MEB9893867.1 hypothetical protein [Bacillus cereus]QVQ56227.1 hypothetical protein [Paenibacillus phage Pd_22F]CAH8247491.1 hypothetical protein WJ0W_004726 [Paenibacillus melissococcoides]CAH8705145.1 hypothetical protein HTL2_000810 [Paenibacillus melissococcoides]CAH8714557.1 hypothetical protein WDD9_003930 [Paenibacillus melissococcoides]
MTDIKIGIHPVHRRMAELHLAQKRRPWTDLEKLEMINCMQANYDLIQRLDGLKQLSLHAYEMGDTDWQHDICSQIEKLQSKMDIF